MPSVKTVLVAGGGVGGLTFARALRLLLGDDETVRVRVLEQRSAPTAATGGHGLTLYEGVGVLGRFGLLKTVDDEGLATVLRGQSISSDGHPSISSWNNDDTVSQFVCGGPRSIRRPDLVRVLMDALPDDTVTYDWRVTKIIQEEAGVKVYNEHGEMIQGCILVAFDGVHSVARKTVVVDEEIKPKFTHSCVLVGTAEDVTAGAPGVHQLEPRGSLVHRFDSHTGSVAVYAHANDDTVAWTLGYRSDEEPPRNNWASDAVVDTSRLLQQWKKPPEDMKLLLAHTKSCIHLGVYAGHRESFKWSRGRVVLGGDAAHAVIPLLGEGANLAMCDAVVLARHVGHALKTNGSLEQAFQLYEDERRPSGENAVHMTWWLRHVVLSQHWVIRLIRDFALPHMMQQASFGVNQRITASKELLEKPRTSQNPHANLVTNVSTIAAHVAVVVVGLGLAAFFYVSE